MNPNNIRMSALSTAYWFCDHLQLDIQTEKAIEKEIEEWFNNLTRNEWETI